MSILQVERPVKGKSEDFLKRSYFAEHFSQAIVQHKDTSSMAIGLYGKWGSGKTSNVNSDDSTVLERQEIREHVCEILEGGEEAFKKRVRKYNL